MKYENIDLLKNRVEKAFGKKIMSAADCLLLSNEVFRKTGLKISINTLRRLFQLIRSEHYPSVFTLDLLSQYCGYTSYSDFIAPSFQNPDMEYSVLELNLFSALADVLRRVEMLSADGDIPSAVMCDIERRLQPWPELFALISNEFIVANAGKKNNLNKVKSLFETSGKYAIKAV